MVPARILPFQGGATFFTYMESRLLSIYSQLMPPSSRWSGCRPFKAVARVRVPLGVRNTLFSVFHHTSPVRDGRGCKSKRALTCQDQDSGVTSLRVTAKENLWFICQMALPYTCADDFLSLHRVAVIFLVDYRYSYPSNSVDRVAAS